MGGGPPRFSQGFTCPDLLEYTNIRTKYFRLRDYHPLWCAFPDTSTNTSFSYLTQIMTVTGRITVCFRKYQTAHCNGRLYLTTPCYHSPVSLFTCCHAKGKKVLALPCSFATTNGIEVSLSSSPYLDVSVRVVPSYYPIDSGSGDGV